MVARKMGAAGLGSGKHVAVPHILIPEDLTRWYTLLP